MLSRKTREFIFVNMYVCISFFILININYAQNSNFN